MAAVYMGELIGFKAYRAPSEGLPAVAATLHDQYIEKGKMPTRALDRLVYRALALWLHAVGFEGDVREIACALQLREAEAVIYLKYLGCKYKRVAANGEKRVVASLPMPLTFPPIARARGPRRTT